MMFDRYAEVRKYKNLNSSGDARVTTLQIVKDKSLLDRLTDKVILITGCSSGLGIGKARAMKATGAKLYLTLQDLEKGSTALAGILEPGRVLVHIDLKSLASVRTCARVFHQKSSTCNILINNAGVKAITHRTLTADGFESQFGLNHLAHFLLF